MIRELRIRLVVVVSLAIVTWASRATSAESPAPSTTDASEPAPTAAPPTPPSETPSSNEAAISTSSSAAPPIHATTTHSGPYARLSIGFGAGQGTYDHRGMTTNVPSRSFRHTVGLTAPEIALHLAVGHMTASKIALGGEISALLQVAQTQQGSLGDTHIESIGMRYQLGGFVDSYPRAESPLHLQAGLAGAVQFFSYSVAERFGSFENVRPGPLFGATGYVGVACDLGRQPGGAGLFARTYVGYLVDGGSYFVPLDLQVGATFAWF